MSIGAWARHIIRRGREAGALPQYGSTEWLELAADDPRRLAAVIVAAEAWRLEYEPFRIYQRSLDTAAALEQVARRQAEADWAPVADYVKRVSKKLTHDELAARRAPPKTRDEDYPGREAS